MINEIEEPRITEAPNWFPNEKPRQEIYWACVSQITVEENQRTKPSWIILCKTEEEAYACACACVKASGWNWDKKPPRKYILKEKLIQTRMEGALGIKVKEFENGEWITTETYPVEVPLL